MLPSGERINRLHREVGGAKLEETIIPGGEYGCTDQRIMFDGLAPTGVYTVWPRQCKLRDGPDEWAFSIGIGTTNIAVYTGVTDSYEEETFEYFTVEFKDSMICFGADFKEIDEIPYDSGCFDT